MKSRLRLIAGPNGSGKTTLTTSIRQKLEDKFGTYLNADDMEKTLREKLTLDFSVYGISIDEENFEAFYKGHALHERARIDWEIIGTLFVLLNPLPATTYFPTLLADFIREQFLLNGISFAFETVMSDAGKIDLLKRAQAAGYRTYLYYVCIDDPLVNIDRVADRVKKSGHNVPAMKIIDRYQRSLANALDGLQYTSRAYFWDNSGATHKYLAEMTPAGSINIATDDIPYWFEDYFLNKLFD